MLQSHTDTPPLLDATQAAGGGGRSLGLSVHPPSSLLSHSSRRIQSKSPYAVLAMPSSHTSYAAGFPAMAASAYSERDRDLHLHASSPLTPTHESSSSSSSHPFLQHSQPSSPSHERLLPPVQSQHQPRFSPYALMHGQSQYAHAASLRRDPTREDVDASEQQQLISASQGDRSDRSSGGSGGGGSALSLADLEAANESEGEGGDRFASSSGASATPIGSPAILHQQHPYASSLPHSNSASSALKLSLDAQSNAAASSRNVLSSSASQYHLKSNRAPVDLAGARKKDDSLQHTGHGGPHSQSNLPLHLQQGVLHVNLSRGGLGLGMGGIGVSNSPLDRSFYTRQLQKLKAVSHQVQARVKRAMSVGSSSHGGALLLSGGGSGLGNLTAATPSAYDRVKYLSVRRWKEIPVGAREKLLFFASSLLGSLFFFILFEALFRVTAFNLSGITEESLFMFSYVIAYLISILYQHALNRLLIFRAAPYCSSLCHTYAVYSISLAVLTTVGACLIRVLHVNPRLIACFTLPASGVLNYYLLRVCIEGSARDLQDSEMSVMTQPNSDGATSSQQQQQQQTMHSKPKRSVSIVEREKPSPGSSISSGNLLSSTLGSGSGGLTGSSGHSSTMHAGASDSSTSSHLSYGGGGGVHVLPLTSPLSLSTSPPTPSLAAGLHAPNASSATGVGAHTHTHAGSMAAILPSGFPSAYAPRRSTVSTAKTNAWQQYSNTAWAPASGISGSSGSSSNTFSPNPVVSL